MSHSIYRYSFDTEEEARARFKELEELKREDPSSERYISGPFAPNEYHSTWTIREEIYK